ncbi:reverse transcriptase domain-containing protein [Tanacetum coccineum]
MDRFKAESPHIKGVLSVLRISAFMHGHGHPELAKKLNDKIPKTVDKMWERVRAFIRGEMAADTTKVIRSPHWEKSASKANWSKNQNESRSRGHRKGQGRSMGTCAPYARKEGFTPLTKTLKEILAMDNQIEEAVALGRLAHLVKDIRKSGQKNKGSTKGKEEVISMASGLEGYMLMEAALQKLYEVNYPLGVIDLEVTMGECRRNQTNIMEFAVVKTPSPYNALLGRTWMRSCSLHYSLNDKFSNFKLDSHYSYHQRDFERMRADINPLKNVDVFAWTPSDMTGIPWAIIEDRLDTYPHIKPKVQKKRSLALDRKKVKVDGSWRMCIDFKDLNKACLKDLYPLPEIDWKIESLIGFKYKFFLDAYKGYHQIHMTKKDEEKTTFHTKEGIWVNLEAYVDDMVIKKRTEQDIIKDVEQTFSTLRKINMKLNLKKCSFGIEEGKFFGYIVTSKGIRANPRKTKAVMDMPSPRTLKQMQSLSGKLVPTLTTPKKGKTLMMYLAVADEAVSVILLTKRVGRQMPIHYVSRSLQGAETNYAPMEKLTLALVHVAKRLRRGVSHTIRTKGYSKGSGHDKLSNRHFNIGSGAGLILIAPDDVKYSNALCLNLSNLNNDAEYEALLAGLRITTKMQVKDIHAFVDSKLVTSQNRKADALSKLAAVQFDHLSKEVLVEKGMLPGDPVEARTLMEMIGNYTLEDRVLYRKSYLVLLMGSYKMHDGPRQVVAKAMNLGYYSPSMHRDVKKLIRACDDFQAHAFGMDIVGPLLEGLGRVKYLIVPIDYFKKWMEAKPVAAITGKQIVNFTWDNIMCRFGILATIIMDNGTQFMNDPFKKWDEKLKIKLISTLVYHPQGNRTVERANRRILKGIKTRLEKGGPAWVEEVSNMLWAHQTMKKTSNGETPFNLTYGTEAVIPVKIGMPTHQTSKLNEKTNDQELRLILDLLEERREIKTIREAIYKQQVEKYYNKKVRYVQFKVGEFVLRKNEASMVANIGKLGPTW